jgi:hypothetical protein
MTLHGWKLLSLGAVLAWTSPGRTTTTLVINARSDSTSANGPFSVIATSGRLLADGQTHRAGTDTVHVLRSAELTTRDPIVTATFIADKPGQRVAVTVHEDGVQTLSGRADLIVVFRTPQGAQLQGMILPPELRRSP